MNWRLNEKQLFHLRAVVKDQDILDLGACDLAGSDMLVELGARSVLAVDRNRMPTPSSERIITKQCYFHQLDEVRPVVFASWIVNWDVNIDPHLEQAKFIVSISKNTDQSACGYTRMWEHLRRREVLLHLPDQRNVLTVYGPKYINRPILGEELAGLMPMKLFTFDEAENQARKNPAFLGRGLRNKSTTDLWDSSGGTS